MHLLGKKYSLIILHDDILILDKMDICLDM